MEGIKIINEKIKKYRKVCGYTQQQIAELLGIDRSTYAYYESGRIKPDINNIMKFCKIFKVNYEDILESESEEQDSLHDSSFSCNNQIRNHSDYMHNLTKQEQELILYYRLLSAKKKEEIRDEIIKKYKDK